MKKIYLSLAVLFLAILNLVAQTDTTKKEIIKTGWTYAPFPVVAFDSDLGFQYGVLGNAYYYGDGSTYPKYWHNIFAEVANTTKNSLILRLFYDTDHLLKNHDYRFTFDLSYLTEAGMNFYGFNGSEARYYTPFIDDQDPAYISRVYYMYNRKFFRAQADVSKKIKGTRFNWIAGMAFTNFKIADIDVAKLNEGKTDDLLPDTTTLYGEYVKYGLIDADDAKGGAVPFANIGLIYDTRDVETNPSKGFWEELLVFGSPDFNGKKNSFLGFTAIHRHYIPIVKKKLTFAYRLGYKGVLAGEMPWYFNSYLINSFNLAAYREGLGGASSLRGVLRNRVIGDGYGYGNFCMRYTFLKFKVGKQNIYLALNGFLDAGKVFQVYEFDKSLIPEAEQSKYFLDTEDKMHYSVGGGLHIALNANFIIRVNYGHALDAQDGESATYITTNWIF